jgi:hypothetical protein
VATPPVFDVNATLLDRPALDPLSSDPLGAAALQQRGLCLIAAQPWDVAAVLLSSSCHGQE